MKKLFTLILTAATTFCILAQAPQKMSYQCIVRNPGGALFSNQTVGIRISILQGSVNGTVVYTETQTPTTNANGLITIEIGGGAGFSSVDWSSGPYFLKAETDPSGGINYSIAGTSQLLSVPYALYATRAENYTETDPVFDASPASLINGLDIISWFDAVSWGDHRTEGYVPGTRIITINGTPQNLSDDRSWSVGTVTAVDLFLPPDIFFITSSTITSSGTLSADFIPQAANKVFASPAEGEGGFPSFRSLTAADIPNLDWGKISGTPTTLSGYGITDAVNTSGDQTIGGNKTFTGTITVPAPVNATDAATKAYVDEQIQALQSLPGIIRVCCLSRYIYI